MSVNFASPRKVKLKMKDSYSALKMDGKPLYEYARTNTPLPRPIEARKCTVSKLELLKWYEAGSHSYEWPKEEIDQERREQLEVMEKLVAGNTVVEEGAKLPVEVEVQQDSASTSAEAIHAPEAESAAIPKVEEAKPKVEETPAKEAEAKPAAFEISMTVSSGTYVRTIIHDIGLAIGSAAHVVLLQRTRQGDFVLDDQRIDLPEGTKAHKVIDWSVLSEAARVFKEGNQARGDAELLDWEEMLLKAISDANAEEESICT